MGTQQQQVTAPLTEVNVVATADLNDIFLCLEADAACTPTVNDSVVCSVAGTLLSDRAA